MTASLLTRAQRIVDLGKAAMPGKVLGYSKRYITYRDAAARDADQIAAKLIEAEALIARLERHIPWAQPEDRAEALAFLATLHQETP